MGYYDVFEEDYVCTFYLFLKGAGDESPQLSQTVVDSVSTPFFDDLRRGIINNKVIH